MGSVAKRPDGTWRARYRDLNGKEHAKHFKLKRDANSWVEDQESDLRRGEYIQPQHQKLTIKAYAGQWLENYAKSGRVKATGTVKQARSHVNRIVADLGDKRLVALQPADVRAWIASLREAGYEDSTIGAFYSRLSQLYTDAVHDGLVKRSPLSRRTSPGHGKRRAYVATEAQVWGLYDLMPEGMKAAIALGAFAGLRIAEAVALRVEDIQGGEIRVSRQYPDKSVLKTSASAWPVPVGPDLVELLGIEGKSATDHVVLGTFGRPISPYRLEEAFRLATLYGKPADDDEEDDRPNWLRTLPEGFRFHDLRHYYASFLIAEGLDVKAVQACMRHESATTTLNKYGHMFPSKHDDARRAISGALARRASDSAD